MNKIQKFLYKILGIKQKFAFNHLDFEIDFNQDRTKGIIRRQILSNQDNYISRYMNNKHFKKILIKSP